MEVGELEEAVRVVVGQLSQGSHLRNGVNGVADTEVGISTDFS